MDNGITEKLDQLLLLLNNYAAKQTKIEADIADLKQQTVQKLDDMRKEIDNLKESETINQMEEEAKKIGEQVNQTTLTDAEKGIFKDMEEIERTEGEITLLALGEKNRNLDYKTISGYTNRLLKYGFIRKERDTAKRINKYVIVRARGR